MTDIITLTGLVATIPEYRRVRGGELELASFRLASNQRHFDRNTQTWVTGDTNWYTVSAFRNLARNVQESIHKGDRVVVVGKLKVRAWDRGEKNGTSVDVDADNIGQDLAWGTARYTRTPPREPAAVADSNADVRAETEHIDPAARVEEPQESEMSSDLDQGRWSAASPGHPEGVGEPDESAVLASHHEAYPAIT
ncbi:single-strand DNA-binding protein [Okibacterium sp. HSC-33S16]|uniref:single-stranded DNA-binding protein n=1 Tax=Okibacterium sp. HSC-33S16 TaxID=2910965 RepID=UPI0020A1B4B8|nr:single-stranded DNA-binding protein [Okibacterium sp. HSC-33S16]MCP2030616.1 single-strand DNA-binding protein [Okibacterium sp. HSC-33S16]